MIDFPALFPSLVKYIPNWMERFYPRMAQFARGEGYPCGNKGVFIPRRNKCWTHPKTGQRMRKPLTYQNYQDAKEKSQRSRTEKGRTALANREQSFRDKAREKARGWQNKTPDSDVVKRAIADIGKVKSGQILLNEKERYRLQHDRGMYLLNDPKLSARQGGVSKKLTEKEATDFLSEQYEKGETKYTPDRSQLGGVGHKLFIDSNTPEGKALLEAEELVKKTKKTSSDHRVAVDFKNVATIDYIAKRSANSPTKEQQEYDNRQPDKIELEKGAGLSEGWRSENAKRRYSGKSEDITAHNDVTGIPWKVTSPGGREDVIVGAKVSDSYGGKERQLTLHKSDGTMSFSPFAKNDKEKENRAKRLVKEITQGKSRNVSIDEINSMIDGSKPDPEVALKVGTKQVNIKGSPELYKELSLTHDPSLGWQITNKKGDVLRQPKNGKLEPTHRFKEKSQAQNFAKQVIAKVDRMTGKPATKSEPKPDADVSDSDKRSFESLYTTKLSSAQQLLNLEKNAKIARISPSEDQKNYDKKQPDLNIDSGPGIMEGWRTAKPDGSVQGIPWSVKAEGQEKSRAIVGARLTDHPASPNLKRLRLYDADRRNETIDFKKGDRNASLRARRLVREIAQGKSQEMESGDIKALIEGGKEGLAKRKVEKARLAAEDKQFKAALDDYLKSKNLTRESLKGLTDIGMDDLIEKVEKYQKSQSQTPNSTGVKGAGGKKQKSRVEQMLDGYKETSDENIKKTISYLRKSAEDLESDGTRLGSSIKQRKSEEFLSDAEQLENYLKKRTKKNNFNSNLKLAQFGGNNLRILKSKLANFAKPGCCCEASKPLKRRKTKQTPRLKRRGNRYA